MKWREQRSSAAAAVVPAGVAAEAAVAEVVAAQAIDAGINAANSTIAAAAPILGETGNVAAGVTALTRDGLGSALMSLFGDGRGARELGRRGIPPPSQNMPGGSRRRSRRRTKRNKRTKKR